MAEHWIPNSAVVSSTPTLPANFQKVLDMSKFPVCECSECVCGVIPLPICGDVLVHDTGQRMTVESYDSKNDSVVCIWFDPMDKLHKAKFSFPELIFLEETSLEEYAWFLNPVIAKLKEKNA